VGDWIGPIAADAFDVSETAFDQPGERAARPRRTRDRWWNLATWLLVTMLSTTSALAGLRWHSDVQRDRAAGLTSTASAVASSITSTLRRQADLTDFEQTLIGLNPTITNTRFNEWFDKMGAAQRYPGSRGFGFVKVVPANQLTTFAAQLAADPIPGLPTTSSYTVFPAASRSQYCLLRLASALSVSDQLPPTLDYCAPTLPIFGTSPTAATLAAARDTGKLTLAAPVSLYPGVIFAFLPVYQDDVTPATVTARRQQLIGWVAGTFDGKAIITAAKAGHSNLRVDIIGQIGGKQVTLASSGVTPKGHVASSTATVDPDGTWWVRVSGTPGGQGMSATGQGIVVFGLGFAISLLTFGVMQVLLRSRGRALRLVREQTEQLRQRALHDDLTGLANRSLIMDRLDQMLHRSRRHGTPAAVLFVDLDSFKDVNDTYGHAIGDALLRAVGDRLSAALRDTDTAGRIGGDEFIVLVDGSSLDDGADVVAARLLDVLHAPFTLPELPGVELDVRASVGVAIVDGDDADDALRNADTALYEAKAAGKSRFMMFSG
jgi:diguanylate cyclase (GGDEF)-like protein